MRRSRGELRRRRLVVPALVGLFLLFLELADEALFVDCATAAGASAAKPAHKIRSASTPTDCQRLRTTLYLLSPKIGAHNGTVVFGQAAYQFVIEIIAARGRSIAITLPVSRTALLDVILQAVIDVFVLASLGDFGLVVQLSRPEHQKLLPSPPACVTKRPPARRWSRLPAAPMTARLPCRQPQFQHPHRPMLQLFPSAPAEGPGPDRRTGRRTRRQTADPFRSMCR